MSVTVYQFLQSRFGRGAELGAAWTFMVGRVVASGTRLFIAALAFATVTGLSVEWSIIVSGGLAAAYTLIGGIRAVIWTDVIQGSVFVIAALAALFVIGASVDGGWAEILSAASFEQKTQVFHLPGLEFSGTSVSDVLHALFGQKHPLWVALLAGFFLTLASHGTDQDMVQRLLTTRASDKGGAGTHRFRARGDPDRRRVSSHRNRTLVFLRRQRGVHEPVPDHRSGTNLSDLHPSRDAGRAEGADLRRIVRCSHVEHGLGAQLVGYDVDRQRSRFRPRFPSGDSYRDRGVCSRLGRRSARVRSLSRPPRWDEHELDRHCAWAR